MIVKWKIDAACFSRILLIVFGTMLCFGCIKSEPILVGFVGEITGKQSELGVQERYGVELAFEEINNAGGVAGRKLALMIRDDFGTAEGARQADRELIQAGVAAIIGHTTSEQSLRGREITEPARMVLFSPTTATPDLSGIDDYFFRVVPTFKERANALAQRVFERGAKRIAIIADGDNANFANSHIELITKKIQSLGGEIVHRTLFSAKASPDFHAFVEKMRQDGATGVIVVAPDASTALIAQQVQLLNWDVILACAGGALTEALLQHGGRAVEGLIGAQSFNMESQAPALQEFKVRFEDRFARPALFGAALAYETAKFLVAALQKTGGKAEGLKPALLQVRDIPGLITPLSLDPFGDIVRPSFLMEVRNLKIVATDTLPPEAPSPMPRQ